MSKLDLLRADLIVAQEQLKESREKVELLEDTIDSERSEQNH